MRQILYLRTLLALRATNAKIAFNGGITFVPGNPVC